MLILMNNNEEHFGRMFLKSFLWFCTAALQSRWPRDKKNNNKKNNTTDRCGWWSRHAAEWQLHHLFCAAKPRKWVTHIMWDYYVENHLFLSYSRHVYIIYHTPFVSHRSGFRYCVDLMGRVRASLALSGLTNAAVREKKNNQIQKRSAFSVLGEKSTKKLIWQGFKSLKTGASIT